MKVYNKDTKKRYKIISIISVILFAILSLRLAILTIARGDEFLEMSKNIRMKDVYITAPRGEIRDRNGILLAGSKPMFTLQILKDEFSPLNTELKNEYILDAITLLEIDSINYNTDFPILLSTYRYGADLEIVTELEPNDRIIEIIIENNLLMEVVDKYYHHKSENNEFYYFPVQNIINSLEFNSKVVPIEYRVEGDNLVFNFKEGFELENWYKENNIPNGSSPKESLNYMIGNDKTIIKKLLAHPINRELVYNLIAEKGLNENIILKNIEILYETNYLRDKEKLAKNNPEITLETTAEEDFINLFTKHSLRNFFKYEVVEGGINVGEVIEDLYKKNNLEKDFEVVIKEEVPYYKSIDNESIEEVFIIDSIAREIINNDLVGEFLEYPNVKSAAQRQLIMDGINPGISISDGYEYVSMKNLKAFLDKYSISEDLDNKEIFESIRDYYGIDKDLSKYEAMGMLNVYHELEKLGQLSYMPINFSYDLKNQTVARIEEQLADFEGFDVSLEPVRNYPNGETAAHILGYMGKISQEDEIEEYIVKNKYNPDVLIGKTGIEESFQKKLYGENGYRRVEVDNLGNPSNVLEEIKPKPGSNIYLSIDYKLQKRAEDTLENVLRTIRNGGTVYSPWGDYEVVTSSDKKRPYKNATSGAVVAIDVKTGEVLALASYPAYDPNLFSTGISAADWDGLIPENENEPLAPRPLYNVATQTSIQPGSTFKMVTALAGLEKGLDPELAIDGRGYIEIGDTEFGCWIWNQHKGYHGPENVVDAIRDSCNYYFYSLALGYNQQTREPVGVKLDVEDISNMAEKLGLGSRTGLEINIPRETASGVPNPEEKSRGSKANLRRWLNNNIDRFYYGEETFDEDLKNSTIDTIVSWIDLEETASLKFVYDNLAKLKLDGEKRVDENRRDTLADIIKFTYLNNANWTLADTINITIGQGYNSYTLTQMTNYVAAIANGGYKNKLTLISNIKNSDNSITEFENEVYSERIELNNYDNLEYLKEGMRQASLTGLNKDVFSEFPVELGIKTGTAQRSGRNPITKERYDSFAYEVGFAPYDNPRIAVGVVIFQGGSGANCSPIVRDIVAEYMGLYREEETNNLPIEMDLIP